MDNETTQKASFVLVLALAVSIFGCQNPEKAENLGQGKAISFSEKKEIRSIHDLDYIADVEIYRLQDSVLIHGVDKVVRSGKYFYLLDIKNHAVLVYDTTGNFVNVIQDYGRGKNEYRQLFDITTDPENGELQLVSRADRKLLSYRPDGGRISSVKRLPKPFFSLIHHKTGYAGYSDDYESTQGKNVWLLKNDLSVSGGYFPADRAFDNHSASIRNFSVFGDDVHLTKHMDYNVYSIGTGTIETAYTFDFGTRNWPGDKNSTAKIDAMKRQERDAYVQNINMFQESEHFITIVFFLHGQQLLGIYDKLTGATTIAESAANTQKYPLAFGKIVGMDEGEIFTTVDAAGVKKMLKGRDEYNDFEALYPEQIKRLRERLAGVQIDEMSNPFLLVYRIR